MAIDPSVSAPLPLESAMCIHVVVPDDGTDLELMNVLFNEKGITRAHSLPLRAVGLLREARTRKNQLPEPALARLVTVIVGEHEADALFGFIQEAANLQQPGKGSASMQRLLAASPYALPEHISPEPALAGQRT